MADQGSGANTPSVTSTGSGPGISGGDIFSSAVGLIGSYFTDRHAAKQAQKARDWSERMANTAHQREVADLRAAGLNPILSGTGGAGAAVPSSPVAQVTNWGDAALKGSALAMQRQLARASLDNTNASTRKLESEQRGVELDNQIKGGAKAQQAPEFQARQQMALENILNLRQVREGTGWDIKEKERTFDKLKNDLTTNAKNAPAEFDRRELQNLISQGEKLDFATYARKIVPQLLQLLTK
ncbi:MAG: DNA pilot protein [Microviridae sp.]|nr:MAG: DNA pilot protein [Microviridae sp.]